MFRYLPLIWKNTLRNRRRSLLTMASIAVSLCLLGFLLTIARVLFYGGEETPAQALRLVTRHRVSLTQPMPLSHEQKIERVPGVKAVMVRQWFGGTYRDARESRNFFARFAIEPAKLFRIQSELTMPEDLQLAFTRERTGCIASQTLAAKFAWRLGEQITIVGDIFPVTLELKLVGIFNDPDANEMLFFNYEYLREGIAAADPGRDLIGQFVVQAETPEVVPEISRAIDASFENSPFPTKTESERAFQLSFASFLGNLKLFLAAICGAVMFTILLVTGNTLAQSVRERIREVGVLKTLGFTPQAILGLVLGEAAVISLVGGAIGCTLAAFLCLMMRTASLPIQGLRTLNVTPLIAALTIAAALLVGFVSALVPAFGASRKPILDALRHTG